MFATTLGALVAVAGCGGGHENSSGTSTAGHPYKGPAGNRVVADEVTLYLSGQGLDGHDYRATVCWPDPDPDRNYLAEAKAPSDRRFQAKPYLCDVGDSYGQAFWLMDDGTAEASCSHNEIIVTICPGVGAPDSLDFPPPLQN